MATIYQVAFLTNGVMYWSASDYESEIVDLERSRCIVRMKAQRNAGSEAATTACRISLMRQGNGVSVETTPDDVQWSYIARNRGDGSLVIVGDVEIWNKWELPDHYTTEDGA